MRIPLVLSTALLLLPCPLLLAQADTAHHRKVYAEINGKTAAYQKTEREFTEENTEVTVTGWSEKGELRKLSVLLLSGDGRALEEYCLEDGQPLFIYTVVTTKELVSGKVVDRIEDRYYFKGKRLIKWLSDDQQQVDPDSIEFSEAEETLLKDFKQFAKLLSAEKAPQPGAAAQVEGVFKGIEQGDYFHWNMTNEEGEDISFFILKGGGAVDDAIENPEAFIGRLCRVSYRISIEDIPEAGGKMEISQITGVEWVKLEEPACDEGPSD